MCGLPLEVVQQLHIGRAQVAVNHHDDGQANCYFRRCYRHDEEHKDLSIRVRAIRRQSDHQDIHGIEHQLDTHKDNNCVSSGENADYANGEKGRAEVQVEFKRDGSDNLWHLVHRLVAERITGKLQF